MGEALSLKKWKMTMKICQSSKHPLFQMINEDIVKKSLFLDKFQISFRMDIHHNIVKIVRKSRC